jgi:hypothetical protein
MIITNILVYLNTKKILEKNHLCDAGTLNYIYGIMDLIEGFLKLEYNDIELWICGNGERQKLIFRGLRRSMKE